MEKSDIDYLFYDGPILIPYHKHPVIHCLHEGSFNCDKCGNPKNNEQNAINGESQSKKGSFFCTYCDYDFCDDCFEELELYKIVFYDPSKIKSKNLPKNQQDFSEKGWKYFKCHKHEMPKIVKGMENYNWIWYCSYCQKEYQTYHNVVGNDIYNNVMLYYCSICNYSLCLECVEKIKFELQ